MNHIVSIPNYRLYFKEVTSLKGLKIGYQIFHTAENMTEFINKIGLEEYFKYGYTLRYVLNNGPSRNGKTVYVAMLFKLGEPWFEQNYRCALQSPGDGGVWFGLR